MRQPAPLVGATARPHGRARSARHASSAKPHKAAALTRNAVVKRRVRRAVLFVVGLLAIFFSPMLVRLPIVATWDTQQAHRSRFQYGRLGPNGPWTTSPLGVLNGFLPDLGWVLVTHTDARGRWPALPLFSLRRPWW